MLEILLAASFDRLWRHEQDSPNKNDNAVETQDMPADRYAGRPKNLGVLKSWTFYR